jgi:hypothetical protein
MRPHILWIAANNSSLTSGHENRTHLVTLGVSAIISAPSASRKFDALGLEIDRAVIDITEWAKIDSMANRREVGPRGGKQALGALT